MRQKIKSYNSLKCSGFVFKKGHISRSKYRVQSPAFLNEPFSKSPLKLGAGENEYPSLLYIPKRNLHFILFYLNREFIKKSKQPSFSLPKRHRYFLFQYHKNFQLTSRLKGHALCLLKTQYAKKPKNPV